MYMNIYIYIYIYILSLPFALFYKFIFILKKEINKNIKKCNFYLNFAQFDILQEGHQYNHSVLLLCFDVYLELICSFFLITAIENLRGRIFLTIIYHLFFINIVRLVTLPQNKPVMKIKPIIVNAIIMKYRLAGD